MTKRATLRELKQDEATASKQVDELMIRYGNWKRESDRLKINLAEAQAMLRNIQQAIKRREKEKRA